MVGGMSRKTARIVDSIRHLEGGEHDPHFLGFFESFNRQEYYVAHDILENLWLQDRRGPKGDFYKGLIQLAGAFVHVQKGRRGPAVALLRLARANLANYGPILDGLAIREVLAVIKRWEAVLSGDDGEVSQPEWPILNPG